MLSFKLHCFLAPDIGYSAPGMNSGIPSLYRLAAKQMCSNLETIEEVDDFNIPPIIKKDFYENFFDYGTIERNILKPHGITLLMSMLSNFEYEYEFSRHSVATLFYSHHLADAVRATYSGRLRIHAVTTRMRHNGTYYNMCEACFLNYKPELKDFEAVQFHEVLRSHERVQFFKRRSNFCYHCKVTCLVDIRKERTCQRWWRDCSCPRGMHNAVDCCYKCSRDFLVNNAFNYKF